MKTKALQFKSPGELRMVTRDLRPLGPTDVLIRTKAVGVCYGDIAMFRGLEGPLPSFGGHEAAGVVEQVGSRVSSLSVGDTVALLGQERFSEHTVADQADAVKFHSGAGDWMQWIAEPIACCVSAVNLAAVRPDDNVAVIGCGFMGLGIIQCLAMTPAGLVLAVAPREESLQRALAAGAHAALRAGDRGMLAGAATLARLRPMPAQYRGPDVQAGPYDVVFEASGTAGGLREASALVRTGGTLVLVGHQRGTMAVDSTAWHMKGLRVLNATPMASPDFRQDFVRTVGLLDRGRLKAADLVTHQAAADDAQQLFEASADREYVKGVLRF